MWPLFYTFKIVLAFFSAFFDIFVSFLCSSFDSFGDEGKQNSSLLRFFVCSRGAFSGLIAQYSRLYVARFLKLSTGSSFFYHSEAYRWTNFLEKIKRIKITFF